MDFDAEISSSKSLVNRYLILKEGHKDLNLKWSSQAKDVLNLKAALENYKNQKSEINIGEGGTSFRFLAAYLSTQKGKWFIKLEEALAKRPHKELLDALQTLGCKVSFSSNTFLELESEGWKQSRIKIEATKTTQVVSGLCLAALSARLPLEIEFHNWGENSGYFQMTLDFVRGLGFVVHEGRDSILIPGDQSPSFDDLPFKHIESDWSSSAFIFVLAALKGRAKVRGLIKRSVQPDSKIMDFLKIAGAHVTSNKVEAGPSNISYSPLHVNLRQHPDLFPVLAAFCCFCRGESTLYGAPQLALKESNRIEMMYRLLHQCGYEVSRLEGGMRIFGKGHKTLDHKPFSFDVSSDHRLFMACEIMKVMGYQIEPKGMVSIEKSFPEYLNMRENLFPELS
jgi:3-phosphoshikimate 1-carboxyvinyltransferase